MNPNKRGPVELGLTATGRRWVSSGGRFSLFFTAPCPPWLSSELAQSGIDVGVVAHDRWDEDIQRICAGIRPDLVHLHMERNSMAGALRRHGITVIRTEHSGRPHDWTEPGRRVVRWGRQRDLAKILCASEYLADQTRRDFLAPAEKVVVVYNGVDTTRFAPRPDQKHQLREELLGVDPDRVVVCVAAHLTQQKRHHLLVQAMPEVTRAAPSAHLVIAGDGPERTALHDLASSLSVEDSITFRHQDNDVAKLYAASDIGALVSRGEGLGSSAVEAQASGLPLIAVPDAGLAETFMPGVTGIAVTPTAESVAQAIVTLVNDKNSRLRMGEKARDFAMERFSMDSHVDRLVSIYDELLTRTR